MKKRDIIEVTIDKLGFGGVASGTYEGQNVFVKNGIPGQKLKVLVKKMRKGNVEGKMLSVLEKSDLETSEVCNHYNVCGGCSILSVPYENQLKLKSQQLEELFAEEGHAEIVDIEVVSSKKNLEYKNKMEFTFGNEMIDAPLALGMHMKNKSSSIVTVDTCMIIDEDYRKILKSTVDFFAKEDLPFYRVMRREGYLRHLVVRKGHNTGEIMVNIVTTSQIDYSMKNYVNMLLSLETQAEIVSVLHTTNDSFSDAVICDKLDVLHGRDHIYEELLGYRFKISPFSFFQTNTSGAEVLYSEVMKMLDDAKDKTLFDLYSGTGTIGIILSSKVKNVIGVEIVEEAVEVANENCITNKVENAQYIAGDVKDTVSSLEGAPDIIILDPPRAGMHPKAIDDVLSFGAKEIIYVSCNPKAFAQELAKFKAHGYEVKCYVAVDQFPNTGHVECVILMQNCGAEGKK